MTTRLATSRPSVPLPIIVFFVCGIFAISQSGNIVRLGETNASAIALWRLILATALLMPFALGQWRTLLSLRRMELLLLLAGGLILGIHFVTWIAAIQHTKVANAASILAAAPTLTALCSRLLFGEKFGPFFLWSLLLGTAGVLVISLPSLALHSDHLWGDTLACICMLLYVAYLLVGKRLRSKLPNIVYVVVLYGVAAIACLIIMLCYQLPFWGYSSQTWICFVLMALLPTIVGHTSINSALRYFDAGRVAVAGLAEPPLAALVAYFAWGEGVSQWAAAGFALIAISIILLLRDSSTRPAPNLN